MKKIVSKVKIIIVSFILLMFGFINVNAQEYHTRTKRLTPSTDLIISMYVRESGGYYVDGRNADIYLEGVYGLELYNADVEISEYGRGYKVAYRAQAKGEISHELEGEFSIAGFRIGSRIGTKVYVYKYIQGVVYFEPSMPNQDCDRWGNCVWSINPIGELK